MDKLCLVFGGDSSENEISILTALKVKSELEKYAVPLSLVYLDHKGNFYTGSALNHKNNYHSHTKFKKGYFYKEGDKSYFKTGLKKDYFDLVLLLCHGANAEDGTLGGYFDTLKIPCLYPGLNASSLLQDKASFKRVIETLGIPQVKYQVILKRDFNENKKINLKLNYPLIIKPAHQGSSIGVNRVDNEEHLLMYLIEAFRYDDCVIVEEAVTSLKEINVAVLRKNNEVFASSLERVNEKDKILSFLDKYDNYTFNDCHIIPADIDKKIGKKIIFLAKKVYHLLDLKSVVRFDFFVNDKTDEIYLNEINAIPGSLSYYLFEDKGIKMYDLIQILIEQYHLDDIERKKLITNYNDGFISHLKEK